MSKIESADCTWNPVAGWAERLSTIPRLDYLFAAVDSLGLIDQPDVLRQVIRITGVASIGKNETAEQVRTIMDAAFGGPDTNIPAVVVNWSPDDRNSKMDADAWKSRVSSLNVAGVVPDWVLFDSEINYRRQSPVVLLESHGECIDCVHATWPRTNISWYGHLSVRPVNSGIGWERAPFTTGFEGGPINVTLYRWPREEVCKQALERSLAYGRLHGVRDIVAWLSLGYGYPYSDNEIEDNGQFCQSICDAWSLGARFALPWTRRFPERFGPLDRIKLSVLYPGLGDARAGTGGAGVGGADHGGTSHGWLRLFEAFCKGASYDVDWLDENE